MLTNNPIRWDLHTLETLCYVQSCSIYKPTVSINNVAINTKLTLKLKINVEVGPPKFNVCNFIKMPRIILVMLSSTVYLSIITRGCNAKSHWLGPWNFFQAMSEKPSERTTLLYHVSTPQAHLTQHFYWCRHLLLTDFLIFLFFGCRLKAQYNSGHQQVATNENRRSIGLKFSIFSTYWVVISICTFVQISS